MTSPSDPLLSELDLTALGSARGRRRAPLAMEFTRELTPGDLEALLHPPPHGISSRPIARLRHSHHQLARLLAEGRKGAECAAITGYSPSRISILRGDPAFAELIAYYQAQKDAVYLDVHQRLASVGMSAADEIQERLETDPDRFSNGQLLDLMTAALDRSVTPQGRSGTGGPAATNITISFVEPKTPPAGPIIDLEPTATGLQAGVRPGSGGR